MICLHSSYREYASAYTAARQAEDVLMKAQAVELKASQTWANLLAKSQTAQARLAKAQSELNETNRALRTRTELAVAEAHIEELRQVFNAATEIEGREFSAYRLTVAEREKAEAAHREAVALATLLSNQIDSLS